MEIQHQASKPPKLQEIVAPLLHWYAQNARDLPWRRNTSPYPVWVSEIMLQQTRVEAVKPYFERFMRQLPDIRCLAEVEEGELLKLWEGLGYYSRVRNLQKAAQIVCQEQGGNFPDSYEQVLALPGIGDYTAGAICSICFELPTPAVDGNVLRVIARVTADDHDIADPAYKKQVAAALAAVYPAHGCGDFTQSLMELGAMICLPNQAPKCEVCPLADLCGAKKQNLQSTLPVKAKKKARRQEQKTVLLLYHQGRLAVRRREAGGLLGGLWELPNLEGSLSLEEVKQWLADRGIRATSIVKARSHKHIFTHVEWHMGSYLVECEAAHPDLVWASEAELQDQIAMPTAFKKLLT